LDCAFYSRFSSDAFLLYLVFLCIIKLFDVVLVGVVMLGVGVFVANSRQLNLFSLWDVEIF
jgi:hypothetical protein